MRCECNKKFNEIENVNIFSELCISKETFSFLKAVNSSTIIKNLEYMGCSIHMQYAFENAVF